MEELGFVQLWMIPIYLRIPERIGNGGNEMSERKLHCPCGGELIALKGATPSGHTHQCSECDSLMAPYGLEDRWE